ncbi:hypothetical protein [Streptomyces millisiae]|uniref:Flagellar biosynthetic protein FliP n=1 Tax=Streptomyces millisiae TaxID=3075542 RepID=A0ABU2LJP7_9ACTN|nr:hypothetical protein [Streptomyces sp. DSM 44918]MDT0317812.1 hypothetical protein [Streptomyces sp. DSM 44918]
MTSTRVTSSTTDVHSDTHSDLRRPRRSWRRFALHYVEMILAMFVGMFALDPLWTAAGLDPSYDHEPELASLLMAFDMSVGMALWMRFRGHAWAPTLEMCGAMFAPLVPLFPLLWAGAVDGMTVMMVAHVAMFPLMLAVMLRRRDEYAGSHAHHRARKGAEVSAGRDR